jgi:hypothetical protein
MLFTLRGSRRSHDERRLQAEMTLDNRNTCKPSTISFRTPDDPERRGAVRASLAEACRTMSVGTERK